MSDLIILYGKDDHSIQQYSVKVDERQIVSVRITKTIAITYLTDD